MVDPHEARRAARRRWLVEQHRGESTASSRIEALRDRFATDPRAGRILSVIVRQERAHAAWVETLLQARGIEPAPARAEERSWVEPLAQIRDFATGCAVGAHAEAMRLARIEAICEDRDAPGAVRCVFLRILPEERFHERAFRELAGPRAMAATQKAHEIGQRALGLVPRFAQHDFRAPPWWAVAMSRLATLTLLLSTGCGVTSYPGPAAPTGTSGTFTFTFNQGELTERNGQTFATADAATYCALVEDAGRTHAVLLDTWGYTFALLSVLSAGTGAVVAGTAGQRVDPYEQATMIGMPVTTLLLAGIAYPFFRASGEATRVAGRAGQGALMGSSPEAMARHCSQVVADYNDPRGTPDALPPATEASAPQALAPEPAPITPAPIPSTPTPVAESTVAPVPVPVPDPFASGLGCEPTGPATDLSARLEVEPLGKGSDGAVLITDDARYIVSYGASDLLRGFAGHEVIAHGRPCAKRGEAIGGSHFLLESLAPAR